MNVGGSNKRLLNAITIIKHAGDPTHATTLLGQQITRQEKLFVPEMGAAIPCAPYDNHFVYQTDPKVLDIPSYMCTCGAPAVIIYPADPEHRMFVCLIHAQSGRHSMSS